MGQKFFHMTLQERKKISSLVSEGLSINQIALMIGRNKSSISRELHRNESQKNYSPDKAHQESVKRWQSTHRRERLKNHRIRKYVKVHLEKGWSPLKISKQISNDLPGHSISHEAIYQYLRNGKF
jgi:IS30 family transposase